MATLVGFFSGRHWGRNIIGLFFLVQAIIAIVLGLMQLDIIGFIMAVVFFFLAYIFLQGKKIKSFVDKRNH